MAKQIGKHAIVIGAGVGGLLFASALANYFEGVTVLERDSLADNDEPRNGVPQGRHFHGLLAGGRRAMDAMPVSPPTDCRVLCWNCACAAVFKPLRISRGSRTALSSGCNTIPAW